MMKLEPTAQEIKDQRIYAGWGLTDEEYRLISEDILGRLPNYTETGLFSVMWSEHCSYKNSKPVLRKFPTDGPQVLQGPGEGAGIVDIGDNQAVVFKAESHNHPSAVEPYEGAATDMLGQGKLYDETVHIRILVQFAYLGEQFLFGNVCLVTDK